MSGRCSDNSIYVLGGNSAQEGGLDIGITAQGVVESPFLEVFKESQDTQLSGLRTVTGWT